MTIVLTMLLQLVAVAGVRAQAVFPPSADWNSQLADLTRSVVLGDVDGDGDLDLVSAGGSVSLRQGGGVSLYLNVSGTLQRSPVWGYADDALKCVTLGDVDGDGDLDLICGRGSTRYPEEHPTWGGALLFRNSNGQFPSAPNWISAHLAKTNSITLGDIDGDGDLDLVCGNGELRSEANTAYLNRNGTFGTQPDWIAASVALTHGIALGDVDGDGDLDLACATTGFSPPGGARIYRNMGGAFEPTPWWQSGAGGQALRIALGDVDGDGKLDLACALLSGGYGLYLNRGDSFDTTQAWTSMQSDRPKSISLCDVDADGDLDLLGGSDTSPLVLFTNDGSTFGSEPAWQPAELQATQSIATGDIDGDGHPDLIAGNLDERSTLYLNRTGCFETIQKELGFGRGAAAQFGDVDADGDLDVLAADTGGTRLFLNSSTGFDSVPAWSIEISGGLSGQVADVDGDGDLDLLRGTALFHWDGAGFHEVQSVKDGVLADVTGDRLPDLLSGNPKGLYRNMGGTFDSTSSWRTTDPETKEGQIRVGDVNGDGTADVLGSATGLYLNGPNGLASSPAWTWNIGDFRYNAMALGDANGDGDLDLAAAGPRAYSGAHAASLWLYEAGGFRAPTWISNLVHIDLGFADVEGDGDLDLVARSQPPGSLSGDVVVYLNEAGAFDTWPAWTAGRSDSTKSFSVGDVDRDGDLDLLLGTTHGMPSIFMGTAAPAYRYDPLAPTHQLPANDAFLRQVQVTHDNGNLYRVRFTAVDVESDPVWVAAEYQFFGAGRWTKAAIVGGRPSAGPFASSSAGVEHEFTWDATEVPLSLQSVALRLRAVSVSQRLAGTQRVTSFWKDLGPLDVRRPLLATSGVVEFPVVTVGDTVEARLVIRNAGNERLSISGLDLHGSALGLTRPAPFDLEPGVTVDETLSFAPRLPLALQESLTIRSNDPLSPVRRVALQGRVLDLEFSTRPVVAEAGAALGEPFTVMAIIADSLIHAEGGAIHYRDRGSESPFQATALRPFLSNALVGSITGSAVTEVGLEYYVELENSGVWRREPCRAASGCRDPAAVPDTLFLQAVRPPRSITAAPVAGPEAAFLSGEDIRIDVELPAGARFEEGRLWFRHGGATPYEQKPLAAVEAGPLGAAIPGAAVGEAGVEYWVEVRTWSGTLTAPAVSAAERPFVLQTTIGNLVEPHAGPGRRFRLLSVPMDFGVAPGLTVGTLLSEDLGAYEPARWRLFRYLTDLARNLELNVAQGDEFRPVPGRGFWLVTHEEHRVDTYPLVGLSTSTSGAFPIVLTPGWNQIGNPFAFPVGRSDILLPADVESLTAFDASRGTLGDYAERPVQVLQPFEGYFIYNAASHPETLRVRPLEARLAGAAAVPATTSAASASRTFGEVGPLWLATGGPATLDSWALRLQARTSKAADGSNLLGVHIDAADDGDGLDARKPPVPPGAWVRLLFPHPEWKSKPGLYRHDVRQPGEAGHVWSIEVTSSRQGEEVTVEPTAAVELEDGRTRPLPANLSLRLMDEEQGTVVDLRQSDGTLATYQLLSHGPERAYRLRLLAGTPEWVDEEVLQFTQVPLQLVLDQNAPNPFNAATRIRFGLPSPEAVTLEIFSVRGERIARLLRGAQLPAGYHTVLWNGQEPAGRPAASGMYFYRLHAGSQTITKRLVLVK